MASRGSLPNVRHLLKYFLREHNDMCSRTDNIFKTDFRLDVSVAVIVSAADGNDRMFKQ
jgi:hypothetical protein